ncbi:Trehalose transport system permease protein SugA [Candidatus Entotheonellaceae bacterium PAL068K]
MAKLLSSAKIKPAVALPAGGEGRLSKVLAKERNLAFLFVAPVLVVIFGLVAYPFFNAFFLSLHDKMIGLPGRFIGLANYAELFQSSVFWKTAGNTFVYTGVSVCVKALLGLTMALILNQERRGNHLFRTFLFLPWAIPTIISALNWKWIYWEDMSGLLNNFLVTLSEQINVFGAAIGNEFLTNYTLMEDFIYWLSDPGNAMASVVAVVVWQGTPFYTMTFLAGLQSIPADLYEAAEIDGASVMQQFFYVTLPRLKHVIIVTVMLSTIWTSSNLQIVYILTNGGPADATQIFPNLAFLQAMGARRLGYGASISLIFFPLLVIFIVLLTRRMLREDED